MSEIAALASSTIFCARRSKKAKNERDIFSAVLAGAQGNKAITAATKIDGTIGNVATSVIDKFERVAKNSKLIDYAGKGIKLASDYVNPLICVASGVKVLRSDDKKSTLIVEASALGSMFVVEGMMKKHLHKLVEIKGIDKIADRVLKYSEQSKAKGLIPGLIKGIAFVVGSCVAYNLGQKGGEMLTGKPPEKEPQETKESQEAKNTKDIKA